MAGVGVAEPLGEEGKGYSEADNADVARGVACGHASGRGRSRTRRCDRRPETSSKSVMKGTRCCQEAHSSTSEMSRGRVQTRLRTLRPTETHAFKCALCATGLKTHRFRTSQAGLAGGCGAFTQPPSTAVLWFHPPISLPISHTPDTLIRRDLASLRVGIPRSPCRSRSPDHRFMRPTYGLQDGRKIPVDKHVFLIGFAE